MNNVVSIRSVSSDHKITANEMHPDDPTQFLAGVLLSQVLPWVILSAYAGAPVIIIFTLIIVIGTIIGLAMYERRFGRRPTRGVDTKAPPKTPAVLKKAA